MIKKNLFTSFLMFLFVFPFFTQVIIAKADDLIIQDDGKVVLFITNSNGVLAATTEAPKKISPPTPSSNNKTQPQAPKVEPKKEAPSQPSTPQAPVRVVPLVPAHMQSTVQINPPINNDKKVQVTITTKTTSQTPQSITNTPARSSGIPSPTTTKPPSTVSNNVVTKTVDQVVAQGSNGQPVITIKSNQARQLTIQQGTTQVTTFLPLQIDTLTHSLSVPSENESAKVSVLPTEALQGIVKKGLLNTQSVSQAKINLTKDTTGVDYTVQSERKGKLFGIFNVESPVQVKLSAQNGKVVKTSQSLLFNVLGGFIR